MKGRKGEKKISPSVGKFSNNDLFKKEMETSRDDREGSLTRKETGTQAPRIDTNELFNLFNKFLDKTGDVEDQEKEKGTGSKPGTQTPEGRKKKSGERNTDDLGKEEVKVCNNLSLSFL